MFRPIGNGNGYGYGYGNGNGFGDGDGCGNETVGSLKMLNSGETE